MARPRLTRQPECREQTQYHNGTVLGHAVHTRALSVSCAMCLLQKAFSAGPGRSRRHVLVTRGSRNSGETRAQGSTKPSGQPKGNPAVHDAAINTMWSNYGSGAHDEVMETLCCGMAWPRRVLQATSPFRRLLRRGSVWLSPVPC